MKTLIRFLFLFCVFVFSPTMFGQITNLLVNGSATHFTMESGGQIDWSYNLPVGGSAIIEIWIDVNANGNIDPGTDALWQSFIQIDGRSDLDGPPDMDGAVNGHISFGMPVGLAPANYIMSFKDNINSVTITGTVSPLTSPVFTISGNVTPPAGKSAQYLIVSIENSSNGQGKFWDAITDASGNFSIKMDGDTTGNPWRIRIDNAVIFSPAIQEPGRIDLTLDAGVKTEYTGNNFTFTAAAAEINGTVTDENDVPLPGTDVYIWGNNGIMVNRNTKTDINGTFKIGLLNSELPYSNLWLGSGNSEDTSIVEAGMLIPIINSGNVITKNLKIYQTNATITGRVLFNGSSPNMNVQLFANVQDTGVVITYTDLNGNFMLHVSNKLWNYVINPGQLPPMYNGYSITAHPGQTNVNFNFTLTDVEGQPSSIPDKYSLSQNYPNPFNPVTAIKYSIPNEGFVSLKIYNVLGSEVATLVNEFKNAGSYNVSFNAENLSSGVYYYKLKSGTFVETKKMILLK